MAVSVTCWPGLSLGASSKHISGRVLVQLPLRGGVTWTGSRLGGAASAMVTDLAVTVLLVFVTVTR